LNGFGSDVTLGRVAKVMLLSIPLNGFCIITAYVVCGNFSISTYMDSIQLSPPGGGLMTLVSARVYKRFSLIPQGFSHAVSWDFQLYTVRTLFDG